MQHVNAYRMSSSNSSFVMKSCPYASYTFLACVISQSVAVKFKPFPNNCTDVTVVYTQDND